MKILIKNGSVTLKGNTILENINFEVNDGEHIGVVGNNGCGKTTLLKAIINNEMLDEGTGSDKFEIIKIGNFKIGYLEQIKLDENKTLFQELLNSKPDLLALENKIKVLENKLDDDKKIVEYTDSLERYKILGGYTYKKDIEVMISKFGFDNNSKDKLLSEFSGGEKMKITFMKLLLSDVDLLILDEPTNHLDVSAIEWLENYLINYKKAFIVVSHDRMFLDNTVKIIYDIDYSELIKYVGNYTNFVNEKKVLKAKLKKDYEFQQKEIKRLQAIYERFHAKPSKAKMAMSKLKKIEQMNIIEKPKKENTKTFKVNFKNIEKPSNIVLELNNLVFGYNKSLGNLHLKIERGKKVAIIGSNGCGKSTLIKTINNTIKPISGYVKYGFNVNANYFDQSLSFDTNGTIIDEFMSKYPELLNEEARKILGSFLFSGMDVLKQVNSLSGGEKVRLLLCEVLSSKANLLLLDEPTNHLDIINKEHLEEVLLNYPETIIFVSHDRYFVNQLADELIVFTEDGVKHYKCGYNEYLKNRKEKKKEEPTNIIKKTTIKKNISNKEIKNLEKEINKLYNKLEELNQELYKEEIYSDYEKSAIVNSKIQELENIIEEKEKYWTSLNNI